MAANDTIKNAVNDMIKNAVNDCTNHVSTDDFDDNHDDDIVLDDDLIKNAVPWDEPFWDEPDERKFIDKIYGSVSRSVVTVTTIWRKYPLISTLAKCVGDAYSIYLWIFAFIKCFGTERAKAKASGKKLIGVTIMATLICAILSFGAGYIETKNVKTTND